MGHTAGNLVGNAARNLAGQGLGKKSQFKKGSDWWKFSIWNRVIWSQPIRIQLGKILRENLVGKSCGKILCENIVGKYCRTGRREKSQFKKDSHWWKFSIWNRVMGSQPIRIQLGKILQKNLTGQGGGEKANLRKTVIGGNLAYVIG